MNIIFVQLVLITILIALAVPTSSIASEREYLLTSISHDGSESVTNEIIHRADSNGFEAVDEFAWDDLAINPFWPFDMSTHKHESEMTRTLIVLDEHSLPLISNVSIVKGEVVSLGLAECFIWSLSLEGARALLKEESSHSKRNNASISGQGRALICDEDPKPLAADMNFMMGFELAPWEELMGSSRRERKVHVAWAYLP